MFFDFIFKKNHLYRYRKGDLNGIPALTNLLNSPALKRLYSRFHFEENDLWTIAALDGVSYNSICDPPWIFGRYDYS